jgi:hypothetical protein
VSYDLTVSVTWQIAKLMTIPFVGLLEALLYKRYPTGPMIAAMCVVMFGVALV